MVRYFIKTIVLMMFFSFPSYAGGSGEFVKVKSLKQITETQYELEVSPVKSSASENHPDPYIGACETFTVRGDFSWFYSAFFFPEDVTKGAHLASLKLLKQVQESGETINFGWMGQGFSRVDPNDPCVVRSRALQLDDNIVTSFYKWP
jgi:hypothetical protein